ncbi:MAG: hypothetical protein CMF62_03545 [Magnetococcales bacterium]|nr:hypothetical protein [Magnetococcales bacterium]|tara:strand:- start:43519 stop:45030 length:1512 start_codon:yes stop_codon:yes gene_type:complete
MNDQNKNDVDKILDYFITNCKFNYNCYDGKNKYKLHEIINLVEKNKLSEDIRNKWIKYLLQKRNDNISCRYCTSWTLIVRYSRFYKVHHLKLNDYPVSKDIIDNLFNINTLSLFDLKIILKNINLKQPELSSYICKKLIDKNINAPNIFIDCKPTLEILKVSIRFNYPELFMKCINNKIIPNDSCMDLAVINNLTIYIKKLLTFGCRTKNEHLKYATISNYELILKAGAIPTQKDFFSLMHKINQNRFIIKKDIIDIYNKFITYGLKIDKSFVESATRSMYKLDYSKYNIQYTPDLVQLFYMYSTFPKDYKFYGSDTKDFIKIINLINIDYIKRFLEDNPKIIIDKVADFLKVYSSFRFEDIWLLVKERINININMLHNIVPLLKPEDDFNILKNLVLHVEPRTMAKKEYIYVDKYELKLEKQKNKTDTYYKNISEFFKLKSNNFEDLELALIKYIKNNNLQNTKDSSQIILDIHLCKLIEVENGAYFNLIDVNEFIKYYLSQ